VQVQVCVINQPYASFVPVVVAILAASLHASVLTQLMVISWYRICVCVCVCVCWKCAFGICTCCMWHVACYKHARRQ